MSRSECAGAVEAIVLRAMRRDTATGRLPEHVAEYAARTTIRALRDADGPMTARRAESYFRAVARRHLLRHHQGSIHAVRLVLDSVVTDLRESGRSEADVWDEISRGWCGTAPDELMEEYRLQLTA